MIKVLSFPLLFRSAENVLISKLACVFRHETYRYVCVNSSYSLIKIDCIIGEMIIKLLLLAIFVYVNQNSTH